MSDRMKVAIKSGPHGRKTEITLNGEPVTNAREFSLSADCMGLTTLTITYVNIEADVDGIIETTAFNAENRTYVVPDPDDEV